MPPTAKASPGPTLEAHVWFGRTRLGAGEAQTGLRSAELALWPKEDLRLFARYDDGLARDNLAAAASDRDSALRAVGGFMRWGERYGTLAELGTRRLPGGVDQTLYRAEQTVRFDGGHEGKLGGWYGQRSDGRNEWLTHLGTSLAVSERTRFEPTLFYSRSGLPGAGEWRVLAAGHHRPFGGVELGGGLALGRARTATGTQEVRDTYLRASYEILPTLRLSALARREAVQGGEGLTVFAVGTSFVWR